MTTLLIIILVLFIISRLLRYLMPYILKRVQKNMEARMRDFAADNTSRTTDTSVKEGETVVVSKPKQQTVKTDEMGDYVDFEEVD